MSVTSITPRPQQKAPEGLLTRLRRDEDGGMIVFSLFLFVLILWFGGMAVDLMRYETVRAKLQGTLDRATLASADLDQTETPEVVCQDYFAKAGMSGYLQSCVSKTTVNYRTVTAVASAEMPLFFYDLPNVFVAPFNPTVSSLTVSGSSTAEERVSDVEISLVLDLSGSMNSNNRIQNLRPAARDFVSAVLANNTNGPKGLITISMVPYSAVVNPGTRIAPYFTNINRSHSYSTCLLFDETQMVASTIGTVPLFEATELPLNGRYDHVGHFDPEWYLDSINYNPIRYPWCHVGDHNAVVAASTDETLLHNAINAFEPYGNTAIDMGMKWGVALLDPSTNAIIAGLAGVAGTGVPAIANDRPMAYNAADSLKVVVLMTDGENTTQYDLEDEFKFGLSPVWLDLNPGDTPVDVLRNEVSIQIRGLSTPLDYSDDMFYWNFFPSSIRVQPYPNGYSSQGEYIAARLAGQGQALTPGNGAIYTDNVYRASWQDLFMVQSAYRVDDNVFARAYAHGHINFDANDPDVPDFADADNAVNQSIVNAADADARLKDICQAARDRGIIVYTIAFEAPTRGETALRDCASPGKAFEISGTDISAAFSAIASDIRALKLTR